jgi:hypothetical protein
MQHPAVRTRLRAAPGEVLKKKQKHTLELAQPLPPLAAQGDEKLCGVLHRLLYLTVCGFLGLFLSGRRRWESPELSRPV